MGLWFIFNVVVFFAAGIGTLYSLFGAGNFPKDPAAYLKPQILFSLFLILVAAGLLKRSIWARAAAVAACIWILLFPALMYFGLPLPVKLPPMTSLPLNPLYVVALGALLFSLKSLRMYFSSEMDDAYMASSPAPWRVGILFLLAGAMIGAGGFTPDPRRRPVETALFKAARPEAGPESAASAPGPAPAAGTVTADSKQEGPTVKACRISLDETRLLLVSSDGRGHAVDLRSGKFVSYSSKIDTREWPASFTREHAEPIGPDADMYFDSDRNVIVRFSDPKFLYGIGGGSNQFISFTSSPGQIVVYNRDSLLLRRIEIPIGTVIWSLKLPEDAKTLAARVFTSPDYAWMGLLLSKNRVAVVGMRDGRMIELKPAHQAGNIRFGAKWMRVSGGQDGGERNSVYLLPGFKAEEDLKFGDDEIETYDPDAKVYVTKAGGVSMAGGGLSLGAPVLHASVLNPARFAVAMEEGKTQMQLIDLGAQTVAGVGKAHPLEFDKERSCFTVSSTRRIFAATSGNEVEIFWSAFLAPGQFRSVVLALPAAK